MFHKPCRIVLCACILSLPASSAFAAHFFLPDDATIDVRDFAFPPSPDTAPDRDLAAEFHEQLVLALQKAGFAVLNAQADTPEPAKARETAKTGDASDPEGEPRAPLVVTPLNEMPGDDPATADFLAENDDAEHDGEGGDDTDGRDAEVPEEPDTEPPSVALPDAATHVLEGRVTLFRETVGNPARVGGTIRIRVETLMHFTYNLRDAATGKVLISDVSSGSSARVTSRTRDIDAMLVRLSEKAMSSAAAKMASHLSGTDVHGSGGSDRDYYQDSPGKTLKPKK